MSLELVVRVGGMTCSSCTNSVTNAVGSLAGVSKVDVSLITEEAHVMYDARTTNSADIKAAIEDCGFDADIVSDTPSAPSQLSETRVSIQGMTCGACSSSITKALEAHSEVNSASISLMTEDGLIHHDSSISPQEIVEIIEGCGFDAQIVSSENLLNKVHEARFSIKGMTCGSCSASITKVLEKTPGVESVTVSLLTEEGVVTYSSDKITSDEIIQAIEDCGFDASLLTNKELNKLDSNDEELLVLQVYGLNSSFDVTQFQYNLEARIKALGAGIIKYSLSTDKNLANEPDNDGVTDALIPSPSHDRDIGGHEIDELSILYDSSIIGVRDIVDSLNSLEENVSFIILNSVDQSSNLQLKLLTKIKEVEYWKSSFIQCLVITIPIIVLSKTQSVKFWKTGMLFPGLYWTTLIQGILSTYVQFKLGRPFLKKFKTFVRSNFQNATMDILMCVSTMISYSFSVLSVLASVWNGTTSKPPVVLFETNTMLLLFISLGKWIENKAKGATSTALTKLVSLTPSTCVIVSDFNKYNLAMKEGRFNEKSNEDDESESFPTRTIEIDLIQKNDIAVVLPGSKVPADGEIVFGESEVDESLLTGESLPVYKKIGDQVIGGSINGPGLLHIKVTKIGKNSQLQKVIKLVKDSQVSKAPIQRYSDFIASRFVPTILFLSLITFIFWIFFCYIKGESLPKVFEKEENGKFFVCLKLAISVIVVACPCALGLASPTAIMVGTGLGADNGILIKGGEILEKANDINILLFDKTGTLTTGKMSLLNYKLSPTNQNLNLQDFWELIGSLEVNSEHPLAQALVRISKKQLGLFEEDLFTPTLKSFESITGMGVTGILFYKGKDHHVIIGNKHLIDKSNVSVDSIASSNTLLYVVIDNEFVGYIELIDEVKPVAKSVINFLKYEKGYIVGMVTGDNSQVAERIGSELGILKSNVFSEISPINKDKIVTELRDKFGGPSNVNIAFIGDGINDAPALSQADIGIAISNGTDIAIESANMVIMNENNDLYGIPIALDISEKTFRRIKINFVWAMIYNIIMVPFAMGCFLPFGVMLPPIAAALSMAFSSVSVVLSSLLLKRWKFNFKIDENYSKVDFEAFEEFDLKNGDLLSFNDYKNMKRKKEFWRL